MKCLFFVAKLVSMRIKCAAHQPGPSRFKNFWTKFLKEWDKVYWNNWKSSNTPPGVVVTNNPVEQFHRGAKNNEGLNKNTSMLQMMKESAILLEEDFSKDIHEPTDALAVSKRMRSHFKANELAKSLSGKSCLC